MLVLPLAHAFCLWLTLFLVELKGTSGFLMHFQCEANVFYNGLQIDILNQLLYQLTNFNPQEEFKTTICLQNNILLIKRILNSKKETPILHWMKNPK